MATGAQTSRPDMLVSSARLPVRVTDILALHKGPDDAPPQLAETRQSVSKSVSKKPVSPLLQGGD